MKTLHVVAAIIHANHKVFATQRGYGAYKDGWEFPGGKIEPGESAEDALIREIQEELHADIHIEEFVAQVEYDYPDFHLSMQCFLCTLKSTYHLVEAEDARWLTIPELESVNWLPADYALLPMIRNRMLLEKNAASC